MLGFCSTVTLFSPDGEQPRVMEGVSLQPVSGAARQGRGLGPEGKLTVRIPAARVPSTPPVPGELLAPGALSEADFEAARRSQRCLTVLRVADNRTGALAHLKLECG